MVVLRRSEDKGFEHERHYREGNGCIGKCAAFWGAMNRAACFNEQRESECDRQGNKSCYRDTVREEKGHGG
jgi:hypothetical protein